jgi:FlaA1/EpsC-like NDP-sugar epimerase
VLIIGAGESGQDLALRLKHRLPGNRYHVVGFIDDDPEKQNMYVEGCRVLGTRSDIVRLSNFYNVDLIVVAIHNVSGPDFREILSYCELTRALIKVVPDLEALVTSRQTKALLRDVQVEDYIGRTVVSQHEDVDLSPVTGKVILVTGAAGSIGSELSRQIFHYHPKKVLVLDNNESGLHDLVTELKAAHPNAPVVPALIDITAPASLRAFFKEHKPQIVFHAAAYKHVPMLEFYPEQALRVNIHGTVNLAELSLNNGVERFVLISTDKAVCPSSVMGASKRVCELLLHALSHSHIGNTIFTSVRFGNVLGSRGSVVPTFNRQIDSGGPVTVTHEEMTRYFMSIPEAVNLIIHAASMTQGDDIFVLRMGEVVRIVELAERMIRMRGLRPYIDIGIEFTGMRPGEKMHEALFNDHEKPLETLHPHIVKIEDWGNGFDLSLFLEGLGKLSHSFTSEHALSTLQNIIEGTQRVTVQVP